MKGQIVHIDYERDERTPREIRDGKVRTPARRTNALRTTADVLSVASRVREATGPGEADPGLLEAARSGVVSGVVDGFQNASALGQLQSLGESLETGVIGKAPGDDDRFRRFPELEGLEVAIGNAAKYPELLERRDAGTSAEFDAEDTLTH